jgi:hypothetical protein
MFQTASVLPSALRSEKERQVRDFVLRKAKQIHNLADYVERHPESIQTALAHVDKFLASPAHIRIHWVLNEWRTVLLSADSSQVASILRDDSPETERLRESPPYFGPIDC